MFKFQIRGEISLNGKLTVDTADFGNLLSKMEAGRCLVTVETEREPKSIEDYRAHYFAMRDMVAEEAGDTRETLHTFAKNEFLNGGSTKELTQEEWPEFIKKFKRWAFEFHNIYL